MSKPLSDKIALVTGASRGIGAALALELAKAGAHVVAIARTTGGLEELDDKIKAEGGSATVEAVAAPGAPAKTHFVDQQIVKSARPDLGADLPKPSP